MGKIDELIKQFCPEGFQKVTLDKVLSVATGKQLNKSAMISGALYPVVNGGVEYSGYTEKFNSSANSITISQGGASAGYTQWIDRDFWAGAHCYVVVPYDNIKKRYLFHVLKENESKMMESKQGAGIPGLNRKAVYSLEIPLPPLAVQEKIVEILDTFTGMIDNLQKELEQRQKQFEYYRSKFFAYNEDECDWFSLPMISENCDRKRKPIKGSKREKGIYPYYGASGIVDYVKDYILDGEYLLISEDGANLVARNTPIAFSIEGKNWVNNHAHVVKFNSLNDQRFVEYYFNSIDLTPWISGGAQPKLNQENLNKILIPYPSVERRNIIVDTLKSFEALISNIKQEIELRQKQYKYYREKLLTFE